MKVALYEASRRNNGFHAGIVKYANGIALGLEWAGLEVQRRYVDTWEGRPVGAFIAPAARQVLSRYSHRGGVINQAIEAKVAYRGTDITGFHRHPGFTAGTFQDNMFYRYYRWSGRYARLIVVNTVADIPLIRERFGKEYADKCRPLGVPTDERVYKPGPAFSKKYDVIWIGKSTPNKNPLLFLEAVAKHPEWRVFMVSGRHDAWPGYHQTVERVAGDLGHVTFTDQPISENDLIWAYQRSRVVVCTSDVETFAASPMEGLFCGARPVVPGQRPFTDIYGDHGKVADFWEVDSYDDASAVENAIQRALATPVQDPPQELVHRYSIAGIGQLLATYHEELWRA